MNSIKKIAIALVSMMMMVAAMAMVVSAADSPVKKNVATLTVTASDLTYTGKKQLPTVVVKDGDKVLVEGTDYKVTAEEHAYSSIYVATVEGMGNYEGTVAAQYKIVGPKTQKLTVKASKKAVKASKKKAVKVKLTTKGNKWKVKYSVVGGANKNIKVSKKGVVTIKKGAKKGTYKILVHANGYKGYNIAEKVIKIKVK